MSDNTYIDPIHEASETPLSVRETLIIGLRKLTATGLVTREAQDATVMLFDYAVEGVDCVNVQKQFAAMLVKQLDKLTTFRMITAALKDPDAFRRKIAEGATAQQA